MDEAETRIYLGTFLQVASQPLAPPTEAEWASLEMALSYEFPEEFKVFTEIIGEFSFPGEILNVAGRVGVEANDTIAGTYTFEMKHGNWNPDMIPFQAIGNGDYFCLSKGVYVPTPVFYFNHEDSRIKEYKRNFNEWLLDLKDFLS